MVLHVVKAIVGGTITRAECQQCMTEHAYQAPPHDFVADDVPRPRKRSAYVEARAQRDTLVDGHIGEAIAQAARATERQTLLDADFNEAMNRDRARGAQRQTLLDTDFSEAISRGKSS